MTRRSRLRSDRRGKGRLLFGTVLAVSILLLGRYFFWERISGNQILHVYDKKEIGSLLDDRGEIYDRNFEELALTMDRVSVYVNVREINVEEVARNLAPVLQVAPDLLQKTITKEPYRAWLAKHISAEEETRIQEMSLAGLYFHREKMRFYPQRNRAAHLVGYVGKSMGLAGVEFHYNKLLSRNSGVIQQSDTLTAIDDETAAGKALFLSVDLKIQRLLENILDKVSAQREGTRCAALLFDTETGAVIGSAQQPSYDPNNFGDGDPAILKNMLSEPVAVPEAIRKFFWDASLIEYSAEKNTDVLPWSIQASKRSLGSQIRLWERLGLNDLVEVDWVKQEDGRAFQKKAVHNIESNGSYDSVLTVATPLHIVHAVNALLAGEKVTLHAIEKIAGEDGKVFQFVYNKGKERVVEKTAAAEIIRLFQAGSRQGPYSSVMLSTQTLSQERSGAFSSYHRSEMHFSYIPAHKLMLFVLANLPAYSLNPAGTRSRLDISSAVSEKIPKIVALQEIYPTLSDVLKVKKRTGLHHFMKEGAESASHAHGVRQTSEASGIMPDVLGMSLRKSLRALNPLQLDVRIHGTGVVVEQHPEAGTTVKQGQPCRIVLQSQ